MGVRIHTDAEIMRARHILESLPKTLSRIDRREIIEAVLGLKCSRVYASRTELDCLDSLSRDDCFGISVGSKKVTFQYSPDRGNWSDSFGEPLPLDAAAGHFGVYLATKPELADRALEADERDDHLAFAALLQIPECCATFFYRSAAGKEARGKDFLSLALAATDVTRRVPSGANVLGQYFDRSFLSHFPCTLQCRYSHSLAVYRRGSLQAISAALTSELAAGHRWPYLIVKDEGIVSFPHASITDREIMVQRGGRPELIGTLSERLLESGIVTLAKDGSISVQSAQGVSLAQYDPRAAWLVRPSARW